MKKNLNVIKSLAAGILLSLSIMGCGSEKDNKDQVTLIFSSVTTNAAKEAAVRFKEIVEENSNGNIKIDVFQDNQLGDDKTVFEGAQIGDIDIAVASTSSIASMYKDYYVFDAPYLFLNSQEVYDIGFNGKAAKKIADGLKTMNLKQLGMWENGFRNYTNDSKEIKLPKDVKGMKIRTMENEVHLKAWSELGANPTPMAFSELFTALQQGTVDGQENPIGIIESNKFYEVQRYISLTEHVYTPYTIVMNLDKWNSLSDEQKKVIEDAMKEATKYQIAQSHLNDAKAIEKMSKNGSQITYLSDAQKKEFQKIVENAKIFSLVKRNMKNPSYFDELQKELTEYRNAKK